MAKPVITKTHVLNWSSTDAALQADYSSMPTLKAYYFLTWTAADILKVFGI